MVLITRRRFVQQTAVAATLLYGYPMRMLAGSHPSSGRSEEQTTPIDVAAIRSLASKITGQVITPEVPEYELARLVGNRAYDRHPGLIVRCANPSDVARSLDFGQKHTLPLAVRSGGHSAAGYGTCDGGLVIDLSGIKRVEVDADKRAARAGAGAVVRDVDELTQRFGLATTLGNCTTVGIGGLTLGGGMGALMGKHGLACDNLQAAEVVTVDGRQIETSQNSNPDLFWAIRGGGGNFGVATALEYRLHPVSEVLAGTLTYPAGRIPELLQIFVKFTAASPDEMEAIAQVLPSDQGPRFKVLIRYCGQPRLGQDLLGPLRMPIKPAEDTVKVMSYLEAQATAFPTASKPIAYFATSVFLPRLSDAAISAIETATHDAPERFRVMLGHLHGAAARVRSTDMAFALREQGYNVDLSTYWNAPEQEESRVRWVKALRAELQPFSHGLYVNGLNDASGELVREAYGPNYSRLMDIKKKYDPSNVLRFNPNIKPS
jgi:FAD/FMN-containing dehydrogenase